MSDMQKIIELIAIAEAQGNFEKSFKLHMEAAERGNVVAMAEVASLYSAGKGVKQDYKEALRWYLKAAEHGHPTSMAIIARMYELGVGGVEQDIQEALKWYIEAANAGEPHARKRLDMLFNEGR